MSKNYRINVLMGFWLALAGSAGAQKPVATPPTRDERAVDSLRRVVAQHPHDTNGTKALVTLMFNFQYNDTAQAGRYGRQALRLATTLGDRRRLARAGYNLATLAAQSGQPDASVRLHQYSAGQFLALGNSLWAGHNYANAAKRRASQGRYTEAMRLSLQGLRLRQAAHDTAAVADSYGAIGQIYLEQQNLPAAQTAYEQSLRGWQQMRVTPYVIQELVQNILKHARATEVTLQIIRHPQELTVLVEDNGVGFDPAALGEDAGIGLRNIESRMAFLGGRADFDAAPGRGTTVTLEVPLLAVAG
jgi:tetratricopeptide (TPR) repeat protein